MVSKIPISQFKSNLIHLKESKLAKVEESKAGSRSGSRSGSSPSKSPCKFQEALRLPNITVKGLSPSKRRDGYSSPTEVLSADNDELQGQIFDNLKLNDDKSSFI